MECETINHLNNNLISDVDKATLHAEPQSELEALAQKRRNKINSIRNLFINDYEQNKDLYEEEDYQRVVQKDFWVTRYMANLDESNEEIFGRIRDTMRWRKSYGVKDFDPLSLPKEFFQIAALIPYVPDRQGRPTLYIRGKMHRKVDKIEDRVKRYLVDVINRVDAMKEAHESWILIIDATDASFLNTDLDMIMFLFSTLRNRYPQGVFQAFIFGLPWILGAFANMVLAVLPSDSVGKIKFGGKKELFELIGEENVPDFMGGSCKINYHRVPRKALPCYELGEKELGLNRAEIDKLLKPFRQFINPELCQEVDTL
ncbi:protein real-time-like [Brevipalpus obovatus]|uniref:protein real-time-like n=1 Tax=Brevipalpus obovatus TaxID=246614 RepID=UPI003D9ED45C